MYVTTLDTCGGDTCSKQIAAIQAGPEVALQWLCDENKSNKDEGAVLGPVAFYGEPDNYVLISAWSGGRQWFYHVALFTAHRLPLDDAQVSRLAYQALATIGVEMDEEEED